LLKVALNTINQIIVKFINLPELRIKRINHWTTRALHQNVWYGRQYSHKNMKYQISRIETDIMIIMTWNWYDLILFNITNIIHVTTSVSRKLDIHIMLTIIAFCIIMLFAQLYLKVGILLACGMHVRHRIMSLRGEAWTP
jgi:hypothetical protein